MTPLHRAWTDGVIQGLREYAWKKNGTMYVGNPAAFLPCVPLDDAIARAEVVWADEKDDGCVGCSLAHKMGGL